MNKIFRTCLCLLFCGSFFNAFGADSQKISESNNNLPSANSLWKLQGSLINKSVLSIEKKVYTLYEVYVLLELWNLFVPEFSVKNDCNWFEFVPPLYDKNLNFINNYEKFAPEVQKLLFITITWADGALLGLFSANDPEKKSALEKFTALPTYTYIPKNLQGVIKAMPETFILQNVEIVLRAKNVLLAKGGLKEQAGNILWFWHDSKKSLNTNK